MKDRRLETGLILALVLAVYAAVLSAPPPPIDQGFLAAGAALEGLFSTRYFQLTGEATYQPLVTLLHALSASAPSLHRFVVVLVHGLNACLLCALARRLGLGGRASLLAGLLLAWFPPATEAVAVPAFAGHVLGLAFALGCVLCGLKALESERRESRWLIASCCCFMLGLLCKETVVITPALLAACWACDVRRAPWRRAARLGAGLAVLGGAYLCWRFAALEPPRLAAPYRADWMLSLGWYARMLLWPWPLCFEHAGLSPGLTAFAGLFVLVGAALALRPPLFLGWLWMALELLPYLHIVPFAHTSPVADRYLYAAACGFCLLLCSVLDRRAGRAALLVLALCWGTMTLRRGLLFSSDALVCEQTAGCAPGSVAAQVMLGDSQLRHGKNGEAKRSFERALDLDPNSPVSWSNLAVADYLLGDFDGALAAFRKSLAISDDPAVRANLEAALAGMRKAPTSGRAPRRRAARGPP